MGFHGGETLTMDVVLLFPGQGSQKPGMAKDLVEAFPSAKDVFERADAALGFSLSTLCFDGHGDDLMLTHNAQPALLAHGAAVWAATRDVIGADDERESACETPHHRRIEFEVIVGHLITGTGRRAAELRSCSRPDRR